MTPKMDNDDGTIFSLTTSHCPLAANRAVFCKYRDQQRPSQLVQLTALHTSTTSDHHHPGPSRGPDPDYAPCPCPSHGLYPALSCPPSRDLSLARAHRGPPRNPDPPLYPTGRGPCRGSVPLVLWGHSAGAATLCAWGLMLTMLRR